MNGRAAVFLIAVLVVSASGCGSYRGGYMRPYGPGPSGEKPVDLPSADELSARYSMRTHGVRFVSGRPAARIFHWRFLPMAYACLDAYRKPRLIGPANWYRIRDKQSALGRLDLPVEAPN